MNINNNIIINLISFILIVLILDADGFAQSPDRIIEKNKMLEQSKYIPDIQVMGVSLFPDITKNKCKVLVLLSNGQYNRGGAGIPPDSYNDIKVELSIDGSTIGDKTLYILDTYKHLSKTPVRTLNVYWPGPGGNYLLAEGTYNLTIKADTTNALSEHFESNNTLSNTATCDLPDITIKDGAKFKKPVLEQEPEKYQIDAPKKFKENIKSNPKLRE